jgi:hypothetical protein
MMEFDELDLDRVRGSQISLTLAYYPRRRTISGRLVGWDRTQLFIGPPVVADPREDPAARMFRPDGAAVVSLREIKGAAF